MANVADYQKSPDDKEVASPVSVEMLSIFSRYEAGLMTALIKTLTLFRGLRAERLAAEAEISTIEGQPDKRTPPPLQ